MTDFVLCKNASVVPASAVGLTVAMGLTVGVGLTDRFGE